jgi:hypothetical protein
MTKNPLERIYIVTLNSVYKLSAKDASGHPCAEKIAANKEIARGVFPIGHKITGSMVSIAPHLQFYSPEYGRGLEDNNTAWWGGNTSQIVALFLNKEEALFCSSQPDLRACDPRWINQTKKVLEEIGEDHPTITICHDRNFSLIPKK